MTKLALVQQFGLADNGGGPKILRSLVQGQPFECVSICCQSKVPRLVEIANVQQYWIPLRRHSRLDTTRFSSWVKVADPWFERSLKRRIINALENVDPDVVHVVPHSPYDWQAAAKYCETAGKPLLLSMHDDLRYTLNKSYPRIVPAFTRVWSQADEVFCICREMGEEYCRRFGKRDYKILTDGTNSGEVPKRVFPIDRLKVYFCGLIHHAYIPNFISLLKTLRELRDSGSIDTQLVIRGGEPFREMLVYSEQMEVLPFSDDLASDFENVDLLYLPLPFGLEYQDFVRFSLSTKLVSYLTSGIPILYHGPDDGALAHLLKRQSAALLQMDRDFFGGRTLSERIANPRGCDQVVENAIELARRQFDLTEIREDFCRRVSAHAARLTETTK